MVTKRVRFLLALGVLVATLLLGAAACGEDEEGGGAGETPSPEASPDEDRTPGATGDLITDDDVLAKDPGVTKQAEVKWGFMFELSGGILQGFGEPTGDGVRLAVKEIKEAGGFQVGDTIYTINLVEKDTQSNVQTAIAVTNELIRDEGVNVIWGPATLGEPQVTPITQAQQVLHLCPCQQRETTALSSVEKAQNESRWAFQTLLPFSLLIKEGARNFLEDWPDFKTMALLCQNTATGQDVCGRTKDAYENVGIDVVAEEYFPAETTDFSPFLTRIKEKDPDYLFNFHNPPSDTQIVRQALELGVGRLHIVTVPANLVEALVGRPLTVPVNVGAAPRQHVQPTSLDAADYFDRYAAFKGGRDKLPFAAFVSLLTYDYVYMLAAAMQEAGTVEDTTAIAEALEEIRYAGVAEDEMFFNSRHLGVHGTDPCVVQTGQPTRCEHVDPPPEAFEE